MSTVVGTGTAVAYDTVSQAAWFNYVDDEGRRHQVWMQVSTVPALATARRMMDKIHF